MNQPRTIHIDVYCTGSEEGSTNVEDSASEISSPQTVFESPEYKLLHHHHTRHNQIPVHFNAYSDGSRSERHHTRRRGSNPLSVEKMELLGNLIKSGVEKSGIFQTVKLGTPSYGPLKDESRTSIDSSDWLSSTTNGYPSTPGRDTISRNLTQDSNLSSEMFPFEFGEEFLQKREIPLSIDTPRSQSYEVDLRDNFNDSLDSAESQILNLGIAPSRENWWLEYTLLKPDQELVEHNSEQIEIPKKENKLLRSKRQAFSFHEAEDFGKQRIPPFLPMELLGESSNGSTLDSHLEAATKFGSMVKSFRKPGHHIPGPPKNPSCPCNHCKAYFQDLQAAKNDDGLLSLNNVRRRAYSLESRFQNQ